MNYLTPLALSALSTNGVHAYLLLTHRSNRKWSISEHAVLDKKGFLVYVLGHILGGAFFLVFARLYYVDIAHVSWLFGLALCTVGFEYSQALLPARGKTNWPHIAAALSMWLSFLAMGALSIIVLDVSFLRKTVATIIYV